MCYADLAVGDLLHGAVFASVDVEPDRMALVHTPWIASSIRELERVLPVRLVVHGRHIAFLDDAVLLGKVGFGKCLAVSAMFMLSARAARFWLRKRSSLQSHLRSHRSSCP